MKFYQAIIKFENGESIEFEVEAENTDEAIEKAQPEEITVYEI